MILDIVGTTVQVTEPFSKIACDELYQQILSIMMDIRRILYSAFQDVLIDLHWRAAIPERCEAAQHFKDEDSEGPPENLLAVVLAFMILSYQSTDLL